jgi:hypothetical protein
VGCKIVIEGFEQAPTGDYVTPPGLHLGSIEPTRFALILICHSVILRHLLVCNQSFNYLF